MFTLLALSAALAAPVPQPAIKLVPIPKPDPDAAEFDKPPKGALLRLGSRQMRHGTGWVGDFAADGRTLFTADHLTGIREWDADANTLRRTIPTPDVTNAMRLKCTPDGGKLLFDDFKRLHVFDRTTKKRLHTLEVPDQAIQRFAVSPDGKTVAVGTFEGHVRLFDLADGKLYDFDVSHPPMPEHGFAPGRVKPGKTLQRIYSLTWSPDGKTLASAAQSEGVRGWNPLTGEERWALDTDRGYGAIAFTPDGKHVIAPIRTDSIYRYTLWDAGSGKKAADLDGFGSGYGLAVSPDGRYFCNGRDIWDVVAKKIAHTLPVQGWSEGVAFSRDGKRVAVDVYGVRIFETDSGKELFDDAGHAGAVQAISVTQDGKLAATAGHDGTARVWDAGTGKLLHTFRGYRDEIALALSPDGKRLAAGDWDTVRVFDLTTGKSVWEAKGLGKLVEVAFSPDGDTLAVGVGNLTVRLFDARTGDPIRELTGFNGLDAMTWHFAWTPDSTGIVSMVCLMPRRVPGENPNAPPPAPVGGPGGEGDGKFRFVLWDVKTGERVRVIGPANERCEALIAIDAEGLHAAVAGKELTLVELKTGKTVWTADRDIGGGLAFTGDDKLYAGGVCLDAKTGKKESELPIDQKWMRALAVPLKGKTVLTAVWGDPTVVVWRR